MQALKKLPVKFPQKCSWPSTTAPLGRKNKSDSTEAPSPRTMQPDTSSQTLSERMETIRQQLW